MWNVQVKEHDKSEGGDPRGEGVITGYVPEVDYEKLGYGMVGYMGIICPEDVTGKLLRVLKEDGSVSGIWEITTRDVRHLCQMQVQKPPRDKGSAQAHPRSERGEGC